MLIQGLSILPIKICLCFINIACLHFQFLEMEAVFLPRELLVKCQYANVLRGFMFASTDQSKKPTRSSICFSRQSCTNVKNVRSKAKSIPFFLVRKRLVLCVCSDHYGKGKREQTTNDAQRVSRFSKTDSFKIKTVSDKASTKST